MTSKKAIEGARHLQQLKALRRTPLDFAEMTKNYHYVIDENGMRELREFHPESNVMIWMSPQEFLDLTGGERFPFSAKSYNRIIERLKQGLPLAPLFIDVKPCGDRWKVVGHEGRHRALASRDLGISKVPVFIYFKDEDGYFTLVPENFQRNQASIIQSLRRSNTC